VPIEIDPQHALDLFPPERSGVFTTVPAGPPTTDPAEIASTANASRRRAVAPAYHGKVPRLSRPHRWATLITGAPIQIARAFRSTVEQTTRVALAFQSKAHQVAIGIARALRLTTDLAIQTAQALRSTARRFGILIARACRPTVEQTIRVALAVRSGGHHLATGIARARQSAGQLAIQIAQAVQSMGRRLGILIARALRSTAQPGRQLALPIGSPAQPTIRVALVLRSGTRRLAIGMARALRWGTQLAIEIAEALRLAARWFGIRVARALRLMVQLTIQVALALRLEAHRLTIGIARALRSIGQPEIQLALPFGSTVPPTIQLALLFGSMSQRRAALALVVACVSVGSIAGMIIFRQWSPFALVQTLPAAQPSALPTVQMSPARTVRPSSLPTVQQPSEVTRVRPAVLPPAVQVVAPVASGSRPQNDVQVASKQDEVLSSSASTTTGRVPAPSVRGPERLAATRAIQRVLNRYRDAFSILDTSAAKAVWPAVDTKALGMAFDRLEEQNLEFDSCRISVTDLRAEAFCRGSAQYTQMGSLRLRTEARLWQFALRKVNENWLIDAVNSR